MEFTQAWQCTRMLLKVYYRPSAGVAGFDAHFIDELKSALDEWTTATDGKICFQTTEQEKDADIDVEWIDHGSDDWVHTLGIAVFFTWTRNHSCIDIADHVFGKTARRAEGSEKGRLARNRTRAWAGTQFEKN